MRALTKENGRMMQDMGMEKCNGKMERTSLGIGSKEGLRMEYLFGQMALNTQDCLISKIQHWKDKAL
jgi:hypothetical protein